MGDFAPETWLILQLIDRFIHPLLYSVSGYMHPVSSRQISVSGSAIPPRGQSISAGKFQNILCIFSSKRQSVNSMPKYEFFCYKMKVSGSLATKYYPELTEECSVVEKCSYFGK